MNQTQQGGSDPKTVAVATGAPLLVLKKLDNRFGATHALKAVDLVFESGEIHAIVGENGAGKSTLIKLLTGVYVRSGRKVVHSHEEKPVQLIPPVTEAPVAFRRLQSAPRCASEEPRDYDEKE